MTDAPERICVKRANDGAWDEVSPDRYDDAVEYIRADVHAAEIKRAMREERRACVRYVESLIDGRGPIVFEYHCEQIAAGLRKMWGRGDNPADSQ